MKCGSPQMLPMPVSQNSGQEHDGREGQDSRYSSRQRTRGSSRSSTIQENGRGRRARLITPYVACPEDGRDSCIRRRENSTSHACLIRTISVSTCRASLHQNECYPTSRILQDDPPAAAAAVARLARDRRRGPSAGSTSYVGRSSVAGIPSW